MDEDIQEGIKRPICTFMPVEEEYHNTEVEQ